MGRSLAFIILALITVLMTAGSCSNTGEGSNPVDSHSGVVVTYRGDFQGESTPGYLKLVIDLTVNNRGQKPFDASPANFQVKSGSYTYSARESRMDARVLLNGEEASGSLTFHVSPQAAIPRTGYTMIYTGPDSPEIHWMAAESGTGDSSQPQSLEPVINIAYSTELMWLSAPPPGIQYMEVGPRGNLYLVVEMIIENKNYESFNINPEYFSVEARCPKTSVTARVQKELIDWRELDLQNNGRYKGSLLFNIPAEIAQSFYRWEYKMIYTGVRTYNIQWTRINIAKCTIEPSQTDLKSINLRNGESLRGKLAFYISPDLAAPGATYEILYAREKSSHNVQFFDRPDAAADVNRNTIAYPAIKVTFSTSVVRMGEYGRLYLTADVLIENKGYDSFYTSPANFFAEVRY